VTGEAKGLCLFPVASLRILSSAPQADLHVRAFPDGSCQDIYVAAGGWRDLAALRTCYQWPDDAAILAVVEGGREARERRE